MKVRSTKDIGLLVRQKRKQDGLTLQDCAALCGVGYVFLSELENGKPTVQLDKVLSVLGCLGIDLSADVRGRQSREELHAGRPVATKDTDLSTLLGMDVDSMLPGNVTQSKAGFEIRYVADSSSIKVIKSSKDKQR